MQVTVSINDAGVVVVATAQGDILVECFFKAEDETADGLRHMGYQWLIDHYPAAQIATGKGIEVADLADLFLESSAAQ